MAFEVDEDILQDFLVEAGEILEQLQEQLVDLENNPEDSDLLNAIFRGYHTVKGGAGFLSLTELVEICHGAENVFDVMRNGQRSLTPELMDVILRATDVVVEMFERVKAREPLEAADVELVDLLHKLSTPESPDENIFGEGTVAGHQDVPAGSYDDVAQDIAELVPEAPEVAAVSAPASAGSTDGSIEEISEDEFEALLDELHGTGAPGRPTQPAAAVQQTESKPIAATQVGGDDITDDEFEALLDELHGKGQFGRRQRPGCCAGNASASNASTDSCCSRR